MSKALKDNLERKYNSLIIQKDDAVYLSLEAEYILYIGNNKHLGNIVKRLAGPNPKDLHKKILQHMYDTYVTNSLIKSVNKTKSLKLSEHLYPTFTDENIEKRFHLRKDHIKKSDIEFKNYKMARKAGLSDKFLSFSETEILKHMKSEKYLYMIQKLHDKIMDELSNEEDNNNTISFIDDDSILHFNNKRIVISKSRNSNPHYLLLTLFKDKNRTWNFDEIADDWDDEAYIKNNKFYNAAYSINKKIAMETTIKDFLVITTSTVKINSKYL